MQKTPNLGLNKPDGTDVVDIADLNANMDVIDGKLGITGHNHNGTAGNGPKITNAGLAAGAADDAVIGSRTVNQALASPANAGTITQLLSWLAGRIKAITGATNWYDAPAITLAAINTLFGTSGHSHNGTTGQGPKIAYSNIDGAPSSMTPTAHASTATTYGVSTAANYGHAMASSATPLINGTATVGTDNGKFAREGHVHPTDTTRAALVSPTFTGTPAAPTATSGTNTMQIATTAFVAAAVTAVNYDSAHLFSSNGYQKLSNGLILQWAKIKTDGSSSGVLATFPIAFPNGLLFVAPVDNAESESPSLGAIAWGPTSSSLTQAFITVSPGNNVYSYFAIGY